MNCVGTLRAGGTIACKAHFHNGEVISIIYEGETSLAPERQDGNILDNLQAAAAEHVEGDKTGTM